jgi:hypothetical protein
MLEHALKYASLGWAVFPCRPNDKVPATPHGCLDATTDPDQIRAWWSEAPNCNIGLACGEPSGVVALHPNGTAYEWELSSSPIEEDEDTTQDADLAGGNDTTNASVIFGLVAA